MTARYLEPKENGSENMLRRMLPVGFAWLAFTTPGKVAYRVISSLAKPFDDAWRVFYRVVSEELNPYNTVELIDEWEKALGLPDPCIGPRKLLNERRELVLFRLKRKRWTTIADWYELANMFGIDAEFTPGDLLTEDTGYGDYDYPIIYGGLKAGGRYRVYIRLSGCIDTGYDYNYPLSYPSESEACARFKCLLERIRPSMVVFIYNEPNKLPTENIHGIWDSSTETFDSSKAF